MCIYHLVGVNDPIVEEPSLQSVFIVKDFPKVFPGNQPRVRSKRDIDFDIDIIIDTCPISILSYRMAPTKLKEMKEQLKDLLDKGFIRPSVSP